MNARKLTAAAILLAVAAAAFPLLRSTDSLKAGFEKVAETALSAPSSLDAALDELFELVKDSDEPTAASRFLNVAILQQSPPHIMSAWQLIQDRGTTISADRTLTLARTLTSMGGLVEAEALLAATANSASENLRELCLLQVTQGRNQEARSGYLTLLSKDRLHIDELAMAGSREELLEDRPLLDRALQQATSRSAAYTAVGHLARLAEDYAAADEAFQLALESDPDSWEAWAGLLLTRKAADDRSGFRQALDQCPIADHPDILYFRAGKVVAGKGEEASSIGSLLSKSLQQDPRHRRAAQLLARVTAESAAEVAPAWARYAADLDEVERLLHRVLFGERDITLMRRIEELMRHLHRPREAEAWGLLAGMQAVPTNAAVSLANTPAADLPVMGDQFTKLVGAAADSLQDWRPATRAAGDAATAEDPPEATDGPLFNDISNSLLSLPDHLNFRSPVENLWIHQGFGNGVAVLDIDRDRRPDLCIPRGVEWPADAANAAANRDVLLRLTEKGYVPVSWQAGTGYAQSAAAADVNLDGFDDLLITQVGRNRLLLNQGDGTFTEGTLPECSEYEWSTSAVIADFTGDGIPDLYWSNYANEAAPFERICIDEDDGQPHSCKPDFFAPASDTLLVSDGAGSYRNVSGEVGLTERAGRGLGAVLLPAFDGRPTTGPTERNEASALRLFVANDMTHNQLWSIDRSDGGLVWTDMALLSGVAMNGEGRVEACMGIAVGDLTGDSAPEIFVTNFYAETNTLYSPLTKNLYGDLTDRSGLAGVSRSDLGFGTQAVDADGDGDLDLMILNGHVDNFQSRGIPWKMVPRLLLNDGSGNFTPDADGLGEYGRTPQLGRALAVFDWDLDGRADLVATHLDRPPAILSSAGMAARLSSKDGPDPSGSKERLSLEFNGHGSEPIVLPAVVSVKDGNREHSWILPGGGGYYCSNAPVLFCGLQESAEVRVRVRGANGREFAFDVSGQGRSYLVPGRSRGVRLQGAAPAMPSVRAADTGKSAAEAAGAKG